MVIMIDKQWKKIEKQLDEIKDMQPSRDKSLKRLQELCDKLDTKNIV